MFEISTEIQYRRVVLPFLQAKRDTFSSKGGRNCFSTVECLFWLKQFRKIKLTAGETKRSFFHLEFCSLLNFSFYRLNALLPPQSTYIYRVRSSVWRLPNCLLNPRPLCVLPPHQKAGGTHTLGGEGWFRKTPDIGLASYSAIPLRLPPRFQEPCHWLRWEASCIL